MKLRHVWILTALACGGLLACDFTLDGYTTGDREGVAGPDGGEPIVVDAGDVVDARVEVDAGRACPTGRGPTMVAVETPDGGSFCIDSTEVTNAQYRVYLNTSPRGVDQPQICAFNQQLEPKNTADYDRPERADFPVVFVDWCDARAFCAWSGKRLCGKIGGGSLASDLERADPRLSQMGWACTKGATQLYPYGTSWVGDACNIATQTLRAVATTATCNGGFPGVFDLVSNVGEWTDDCDATTGQNDACPANNANGYNAGGVEYRRTAERCDHFDPHFRGDSEGYIGFRCCAD